MTLKVFISYSHEDNADRKYIDSLKRHLAPLKNQNIIQIWDDKEVIPGKEFSEIINSKIDDADIILLCISSHFLNSSACLNEKMKALELRLKKGIQVIPIILTPCGWKSESELPKLLALPYDAKPISQFEDQDSAWHGVYNGLMRVIESELIIKKISINKQFKHFLCDSELLANAHSKKELVSLEDIFIDIELKKFDSSKKDIETVTSDELIDYLQDEGKIIIAGEDQSGKTTLCKRLFYKLRKLNFIPVYVSGQKISSRGKIQNMIIDSLHEQYDTFDEKKIDIERFVPIVDDFHFSNEKEKHLTELTKYPHYVIIIDDVFGLNIKNTTLISSLLTFKIKELKSSLRVELVRKWVSLADKTTDIDYKAIDINVERINTILGRNIGKGLIPAYPFFIISTLVTYDTILTLDQDITSQGYCYQAFIYFYLRKHNVKNDEIDIYLNFLGEFAYYLHQTKQNAINNHEFSIFIEKYNETFNLPIKSEILLNNLKEIILKDTLNNYSFKYPCFHYYFVAKSISEHFEDPDGMERVKAILNNLHVDENAYITVFLIHHSKNNSIIKEIQEISNHLFEKCKPASLTKQEMNFLDTEIHSIIRAALPPGNITPEMERTRRLEIEDKMEISQENNSEEELSNDNNAYEIDMRRAIKTVEVLGCIIKNRAGSLKKVDLQNIFLNGMNLHLRILSFFIQTLQNEEHQNYIIEIISNRLSQLDEGKDQFNKLSDDERGKNARIIFFNIHFFLILGTIYKIVHSLGSDKLLEISNITCDQVDNPASFLIKHGIIMSYDKNLIVEDIYKGINDKDFSEIAKRCAEILVVDYCAVNQVHYRERQKIESMLKIPRNRLH